MAFPGNSTKKFEVNLEFHVEAVTCPGVWLCPNGQVSLSVCALGSVFQTKHLPPTFPLCFDDKFYFRKTLPFYPYDLTLLVDSLDDEAIYCELVQWNGGCSCGLGRVLARYSGLIGDLLFPPYTCKPAGVDLLMKPSADYPGILAPKIEVTTLIRLPDVLNYKDDMCLLPCLRRESSYSPKRIPIRTSRGRRQKPVCHSPDYHQPSEPDIRRNYSRTRQYAQNSDMVETIGTAPRRRHRHFNDFTPVDRRNSIPEKTTHSNELTVKSPSRSSPKVNISKPFDEIKVDRCLIYQGRGFDPESKEAKHVDSYKLGQDGCLICYKYFAVFKCDI